MPKADTAKNKWMVWTSTWLGGYVVLLHGTDKHMEGWEYSRIDGESRIRKITKGNITDTWRHVFTNTNTDFEELPEEEAIRILIGGPLYGVSKYSNSTKTYGVPRVR